MNATKKESLGSKSEGDERMLDGEIAKFVRKLNKYKSKEYAKNWQFSMGRSSGKDEKKDKSIIKEFKIECFKYREKGRDISPPNVLYIKKSKKVMQVTWSESKSCQSSENKSNGSEECTNLWPLWQVSIRNHS